MSSLFEWIHNLTVSEGISYFSLLMVSLAIIPYSNIILSFLKHIVYGKELKINYFKYTVSPYILVGKDKNDQEIYVDVNNDDLFISGSNIHFVWQVDGAYRVDLKPVRNHIKGNTATLVIDPRNTTFTLEAYGFFGKKISSIIELPSDKIFHVDVSSISNFYQLNGTSASIKTTVYSRQNTLNASLTRQSNFSSYNWLRQRLRSVITRSNMEVDLFYSKKYRKPLNDLLEYATQLKGYSFSTKKYNELLDHNKYNNPTQNESS